ncbi:MAG: hypothetical protein KDM91_22945 [Verrucomicrobiae bacterium]|nr:hypothetical protein [Verrucomicrobiae bacterium]
MYLYDWPWAFVFSLIGFVAEFGVFRLYTRTNLSIVVSLRRLVMANLASFAIGCVIMGLFPFRIPKVSLGWTVIAFVIAYLITVSVEFPVLRSLLPENRRLMLRGVTMANFVSYAILFGGYLFWFFNWGVLLRFWFGNV